MHLVEVDPVGAQPAKRLLHLLPNARGGSISEHVLVAVPRQAAFGGDHHTVALAAGRPIGGRTRKTDGVKRSRDHSFNECRSVSRADEQC